MNRDKVQVSKSNLIISNNNNIRHLLQKIICFHRTFITRKTTTNFSLQKLNHKFKILVHHDNLYTTDYINSLKLLQNFMDPRPYHFEYRRPRVSNPTYQSHRLYASINQPYKYSKNMINNHQLYSSIKKDRQLRNPSLPPIDHNNSSFSPKKQSKDSYNENHQKLYQNASMIVSPTYKTNQSNLNSDIYKFQPQRPQFNINKAQENINQNHHQANQFKNSHYENSIKNYRKQLSYRKHKVDNPQNFATLPLHHQKQLQYNKKYAQNPTISFENQHVNKRREYLDHKNQYQKQVQQYKYNHNLQRNLSTINNSQDGSREANRLGSSSSDQDYIFNKQIKPYNIITGDVRQLNSTKNHHRMFPKISLQNKLIQSGLYFPNKQAFKNNY